MSDERTFGERELAGDLPTGLTPDDLEAAYGDGWRKLTPTEAKAISEAAFERHEASLLHHYSEAEDARERQRIGGTLHFFFRAGAPLDDNVTGAVIDELYGDAPTERQTNLVLDVVAGVKANLRGEATGPA